MSQVLQPQIPVDEYHGMGGSYVIENGKRLLVHRTRELGEAEPIAAAPASSPAPIVKPLQE